MSQICSVFCPLGSQNDFVWEGYEGKFIDNKIKKFSKTLSTDFS